MGNQVLFTSLFNSYEEEISNIPELKCCYLGYLFEIFNKKLGRNIDYGIINVGRKNFFAWGDMPIVQLKSSIKSGEQLWEELGKKRKGECELCLATHNFLAGAKKLSNKKLIKRIEDIKKRTNCNGCKNIFIEALRKNPLILNHSAIIDLEKNIPFEHIEKQFNKCLLDYIINKLKNKFIILKMVANTKSKEQGTPGYDCLLLLKDKETKKEFILNIEDKGGKIPYAKILKQHKYLKEKFDIKIITIVFCFCSIKEEDFCKPIAQQIQSNPIFSKINYKELMLCNGFFGKQDFERIDSLEREVIEKNIDNHLKDLINLLIKINI